MRDKHKTSVVITIVSIAVIVVLASTIAFSYSEMNAKNQKISELDQKISELDGKISSQNSTILTQNSTISSLKSNETNMSLIIATIQSEVKSVNGNYTNLSLLFSSISQIYGIHIQLLQRLTITVPSLEYQFLRQGSDMPNNTTLLLVSSVWNNGFVPSNNSTSSLENFTYIVSAYPSSGITEEWVTVTSPDFISYFYNTGNSSVTFNYTLFEIWRS